MDDMVRIPGGEFWMGSDEFYPEERPAHPVRVAEFLLDRHPVTNRQFRQFVEETGYVTEAEHELSATEFSNLSAEERAPGSLVFTPTEGPVDLRNWRAWWQWVAGANWRNPRGPGSSLDGRDEHPVVQVCFADAAQYAAWAGKRLPTETEWERAARGGLDRQPFAWGDELAPGGELRANTWQGAFPYRNTGARGWVGTSPVGVFAETGFGLFDMIGNVWEWTGSVFTASHAESSAEHPVSACGCSPVAAPKAEPDGSKVLADEPLSAPDSSIRRVTKGGSHLCAPEYCQRYRPAARSPQTEDSATSHLGFRCAVSV